MGRGEARVMIIVGLAIYLVGMFSIAKGALFVGVMVVIFSMLPCALGCVSLAQQKGYPGWLGILAAVLGPTGVGPLIVLGLPDVSESSGPR